MWQKDIFKNTKWGGYLDEYPIRVNCLNCHALLKGLFIMNPDAPYKGLYMVNADIEECEIDIIDVENDKLSTDGQVCTNADYVAEISGELPCKHTSKYDKGIPVSPFLKASDYLDGLEDYIERLRYFNNNMKEWKRQKSTAFQLLNDGSIDYISKALKNKMGEYIYECDHYLKSLHCLQEVVLEETKDLFIKPLQDEHVKNLVSNISEIDSHSFEEFVKELGGIKELILLYRKTIDIFSDFMDIYPNILPAETYIHFNDTEGANTYISTCSFSDIKAYYQDAYEDLLSIMYLPVCLDNIKHRNNYQSFDNNYNDVIKSGKGNKFKQYKKLIHGIRFNKLNKSETFQSLIGFTGNIHLRNGIGHNNYEYDSITQSIIAHDKNKDYKGSLMEVAIDCIGLVKSAVSFSEILLFILRYEFKKEGIHSIIHPRFYEGTESNDKCPCGSGLKYKKCCQLEVEKVMRSTKK